MDSREIEMVCHDATKKKTKKKKKKKPQHQRKRSKFLSRLPEDVILEILFRLPLKSLLRFRCISKDWLGLISSSHIHHLHDRHSRKSNPPLLVLFHRQQNLYPTAPTSLKPSYRVSVMELDSGKLKYEFGISEGNINPLYDSYACHGLICFVKRRRRSVFVCNPITRESIKLPKESAGQPKQVGIGFLAPPTNQYKVVRWFCLSVYDDPFHEKMMGCEILTLSDGGDSCFFSWRRRANHPKLELGILNKCVDGVLYFGIGRYNMEGLLAFDLEREESTTIPAPQSQEVATYHTYLLELRGCLCFVRLLKDESTKIWVLKINEEEQDQSKKVYDWVLRYDISYAYQVFACIPATTRLHCFGRESEMEKLVVLETESKENSGVTLELRSRIHYYSTKKKMITCRSDKKLIEHDDFGHACVYYETLFSLDAHRQSTFFKDTC